MSQVPQRSEEEPLAPDEGEEEDAIEALRYRLEQTVDGSGDRAGESDAASFLSRGRNREDRDRRAEIQPDPSSTRHGGHGQMP